MTMMVADLPRRSVVGRDLQVSGMRSRGRAVDRAGTGGSTRCWRVRQAGRGEAEHQGNRIDNGDNWARTVKLCIVWCRGVEK